MTKDEQIEKFTHLITEARNLKRLTFKRYGTNPEFDKWIRRVKRRIDNLCGVKSTNSNNFNSIKFNYNGPRGMDGVQVPIDNETYQNGLIKTIGLLESIIEEIEEGIYDDLIRCCRMDSYFYKRIFLLGIPPYKFVVKNEDKRQKNYDIIIG